MPKPLSPTDRDLINGLTRASETALWWRMPEARTQDGKVTQFPRPQTPETEQQSVERARRHELLHRLFILIFYVQTCWLFYILGKNDEDFPWLIFILGFLGSILAIIFTGFFPFPPKTEPKSGPVFSHIVITNERVLWLNKTDRFKSAALESIETIKPDYFAGSPITRFRIRGEKEIVMLFGSDTDEIRTQIEAAMNQ